VNVDQLKVFRDIAATRSVSRGAGMNGVSQSAASQMLKSLEKSIGVKLLDSSTRPLSVTEAGHLYLDLCRDVLRRYDDFQNSVGTLRNTIDGTVRVAAIYSVGVSEMASLEREFARRHPGAKLEVEYLRPERVYEAVTTDRADLGLVSYPESSREIAVIPWREEEMVVAASPFHPLAGRQAIDPIELDGYDFIGFDEELPIRREIDRYLESQGVTVRIPIHFDNLQSLKEAVVETRSLSILPGRLLLKELSLGRLVAIPISSPRLFRPLGIIHRRRKHFHPAAQTFLDLLQAEPQVSLELAGELARS
jgi:LysR family transcriptional regulator, transcriptional activator of the cysJI operon